MEKKIGVIILCLMFFALPAWGGEKPAAEPESGQEKKAAESGTEERQYRESPTGEGALTVVMLKNCIKLKKKIDKQQKAADKEERRLGKQKKELEDFVAELKKEAEGIDPKDNEAITAHNERAKMVKIMNEEYIQAANHYNQSVSSYNKRHKKFVRQCKGQKYYDDDYEQAVEEVGYGF